MGKSNLHEGHRERLKNRFLYGDLDLFQPHEVLELLLFYGICRKDTNGIAHELIDTFGSISSVLEAPLDKIAEIKGVTKNAAILLKFVPEICRYYLLDKHENKEKIMTKEKAGAFILDKFVGKQEECVIVMLLDKKMRMLYCGTINRGNVNKVDCYLKDILLLVSHYNAYGMILAHNHPSGVALPSAEDVETTVKIIKKLEVVQVKLLDHFIIADREYISLFDNDLV